MPTPHHVVAFPLTVYLAPEETDFPAVDDDEAAFDADWFTLGSEGAYDYEDAGVTVTHSQTIEPFTGAAGTIVRKAFRTAEGFALGFALVDLTPEQYAKVLDDAAVTTVAAGPGVAGEKSFEGRRGIDVEHFALLARGQSSVENGLNMQVEVASCYQSAEPAPVFAKGTPAALAVEFTVINPGGPAENPYVVRVQTAPATS